MADNGRNYKPPSWSTKPKFPFSLEVLKDGVIVEKIDISKLDHYLCGKRPDLCDVVLQHESISRQHAVLQFGEQGELYVADLGSTHGTKVNKQALVPNKYTLAPVGSVIQFGQSTRLYVVDGPPQLAQAEAKESAAHANLRKQSEERQQRKASEKILGGPAVSWGQHEDAVDDGSAFVPDDGYDAEDAGTPRGVVARLGWIERLDLTKLGEKDRAAYDRLHKSLLKLRHLLAETERIKAKQGSSNRGGKRGRRSGDDGDEEGGASSSNSNISDSGMEGLTEGQVAQIARNEDAIERILQSVDDDEEALKERLVAKGIPLPTGVAPGPSRGSGGAGFGGLNARDAAGSSFLPDAEDEVEDHSSASWNSSGNGSSSSKGKFVLKKGSASSSGITSSTVAASKAPEPSRPRPTAASSSSSNSSHGNSGNSSGGPETYESLQAKLAAVDEQLAQLAEEEAEIERSRGGVFTADVTPSSAAASSGGTGDDDELESYMKRTTAALEASEGARREAKKAQLHTERGRLSKLLDLVKPALDDLLLGSAPKPTPAAAAPPPVKPAASASTASSMDALVTGAVVTTGSTKPIASSEVTFAVPAPRPTAAVKSPVALPVERGSSSGGSSEGPVIEASSGAFLAAAPGARPAKRVLGPAMPPPSAVAADSKSSAAAGASSSHAEAADHPSASGPTVKRPKTMASVVQQLSASSSLMTNAGVVCSAAPAEGLEEGSDLTWKPPADQTGDGRTALNEKLGY